MKRISQRQLKQLQQLKTNVNTASILVDLAEQDLAKAKKEHQNAFDTHNQAYNRAHN